jgi:hypothetical protein
MSFQGQKPSRGQHVSGLVADVDQLDFATLASIQGQPWLVLCDLSLSAIAASCMSSHADNKTTHRGFFSHTCRPGTKLLGMYGGLLRIPESLPLSSCRGVNQLPTATCSTCMKS